MLKKSILKTTPIFLYDLNTPSHSLLFSSNKFQTNFKESKEKEPLGALEVVLVQAKGLKNKDSLSLSLAPRMNI